MGFKVMAVALGIGATIASSAALAATSISYSGTQTFANTGAQAQYTIVTDGKTGVNAAGPTAADILSFQINLTYNAKTYHFDNTSGTVTGNFNATVDTLSQSNRTSGLVFTSTDPTLISNTNLPTQLTFGYYGNLIQIESGSFGTGDSRPGNTPFATLTPAAAVPEPAAWAMMILGMGAIGFAMRSAKLRSDQRFDARIKRITDGAPA